MATALFVCLHNAGRQPLEAVRATRDEIGARAQALVAELDAAAG